MQTKLNHQNGVIRICVDQVEGNRASGRVFSQRLSAPISFTDLGSLLLQLEELLEEQDFPQAFQRIRSFTPKAPEYPASVLPENAMAARTVAEAAGEKSTFALNVLTRRNATWQGSVDWLDGGEPAPFSSDLEFLSLVERRLSAL